MEEKTLMQKLNDYVPEAYMPKEYMKDAHGNLMLIASIRPIDLAEDELVKEKVQKVLALHEQMKMLKAELLGDIEAFVQLSAERYGVKLGGKKGNVTLTSYDGAYNIKRQITEHITFDVGLQAAKSLIDGCLRDWSKDSGTELRTLVDYAFRVDKEGKLNTGAILGLRRHDFTDERWKRAMYAISESIKVTGSRAYVRFYKRDEQDNYQPISLDMAGI